MRCAGGHGHGHDDHHAEHHERVHSRSLNTTFVKPTQHDLDHQIPTKPNWLIRLNIWLYTRWNPDRDNVINNVKVNKLSAYYWFGNYSL